MTVTLAFARVAVEFDEESFSESILSSRLSYFISSEPKPSRLTLRLSRASSADGEWKPFVGAEGVAGGYRVLGNGVQIHPDVGDRGALLALRILFARAIESMRGVLVHASCVEVDGRAGLATGVSGAGKSTIARWAQRAGATLLSDEVVGLLPDGRVLGTPFFSDRDLVGSPTEARLSVAMTLHHGEVEAFSDCPAYDLVQALCGQAFKRVSGVEARDALVCIASALSGVRTGTFTCRNAPSAGTDLVKLLRVRADG